MGTSIHIITRLRFPEDHPHACGDKTATLSKGGKIQGSSPRVWGQDANRLYQYDRIRIIPTRVGTRAYLAPLWLFSGDHPHACGDKNVLGAISTSLEGSSPRVWGQGKRGKAGGTGQGIIPTRVGTRKIYLKSY